MSFIKSQNGEAHCCQRGGVDIGIWIVALNGRLTRNVSLFAAKLSIVPKFVGLQIPVQIFNVGIAPRSLRGHSWIRHKNYVLLQPYLQNVGGRLPVNSVETTQSWWSTGEARLVRKTLLLRNLSQVTRWKHFRKRQGPWWLSNQKPHYPSWKDGYSFTWVEVNNTIL